MRGAERCTPPYYHYYDYDYYYYVRGLGSLFDHLAALQWTLPSRCIMRDLSLMPVWHKLWGFKRLDTRLCQAFPWAHMWHLGRFPTYW